MVGDEQGMGKVIEEGKRREEEAVRWVAWD